MINKISKAIPAKSLGYMLICCGIILVVVLGLISFHQYNANKAQSVKILQNKIDEQKGLGPLYLLMLKELQKKEDFVLPNPQQSTLPREKTDKFQDDLRKIARKSGVMALSVLPDVKTIAGKSSNVLFNATFRGELSNFRKFVIELGAVPYVDHIDEFSIKQYSDSMECQLKIWVAVAD